MGDRPVSLSREGPAVTAFGSTALGLVLKRTDLNVAPQERLKSGWHSKNIC